MVCVRSTYVFLFMEMLLTIVIWTISIHLLTRACPGRFLFKFSCVCIDNRRYDYPDCNLLICYNRLTLDFVGDEFSLDSIKCSYKSVYMSSSCNVSYS